ncbi:hypothetical protein H2199_008063 [Coniosporium tulheliwenetii]|uniref:Uncharacterized protein n=1 Tax=Coniosporium tulheliwenetii TaxID=3383036 RepID=A0ACC2YM23_9PEZI|nr:hypothetical protein H2199_008063 [Cladosporium sp. JES 115]
MSADASALHSLNHPPEQYPAFPQTAVSPNNPRKRRASGNAVGPATAATSSTSYADPIGVAGGTAELETPAAPPPKKGRTNTPWTPAEEQRLKTMRDAGSTWSEIAKSAALLAAIKDYEASKWKVIGQKVGKPAKACEQYAKEHFGGKV